MNLFKVFEIIPSSILHHQNKHIFNFITKLAMAETDGAVSKIETTLIDKLLDPSDKILEYSDYIPEFNIYDSEKTEPFEVDASCVLEDTSQFFEQNV